MSSTPPRLVADTLGCFGIGPVSFTVEAGACLALSGPSGSGKSLVLRMVADLIPHEGSCRLDGVPMSQMSGPAWRTLVRYVAAEPGWWAGTVGEHFADRSALPKSFARLGLSPALIDVSPHQLSTGERQRAALLRAIEDEPKVLLLDEPTSALDPVATEAVERLVSDLKAQGTAVVLVSHNGEQVERLAEQVVRMGAKS